MAKRKRVEMVKLTTLLICRGQFFVFTKQTVQVALLSIDETARLWDGLAVAEQCTLTDVDVARATIIRSIFGKDVESFLPAGTVEALMHYAEHYVGKFADEVKGICACILTGTPFGGPEDDPGTLRPNSHAELPVIPKSPAGPSGATFDPAELEALMIESQQV